MTAHSRGAQSFAERQGGRGVLSCARAAAWLSCLSLMPACGDDDSEPQIPGDTGSVSVLAQDMATPTTVAIRNGSAWVPEGQFTHLPALGGTTPPGPFQVLNVSLNGDGIKSDRISLPDDYYPEGIAANLATGELYVGSALDGTILKVPSTTNTAEPFLASGVLERGAFGLRVDNPRGLIWVCDSNLGATPARPGGTLVGLRLSDKSVAVRHALPEGSICNDIQLDASYAVFVTETAFGGVYRIAPDQVLTDNSAKLWLEHPALAPPPPGQLGANGIAFAGGRMFIGNTSAGTLVRVDPSAADPASTVSVVSLTEAGSTTPVTLSGPDGILKMSDTELLVVENGFGGPGLTRLSQIRLDPE